MKAFQFITEISAVCKQTAAFQLEHFGTIERGQIADKGLNQLVSFVDVETEKILVSELGKLIPGSAFITEENTIESNRNAEYVWIIDPLDGTTNFLHGLPAFSISVALMHRGEIVAGVVHVPVYQELFAAEKGRGSFLNGEPIHVTHAPSLSESLLATGFPYYDFDRSQDYLKVLGEFMRATHGLRRIGSAAIDLAYTACGRFEGFFEYGLNAWDVAAGVLLVQEAGGKVTAFSEEKEPVFGAEIIASNGAIHAEMQEVIRRHLL